MNKPHVVVAGMGRDSMAPALARALSRLSAEPMIANINSMQEQKETPAAVLVDDTTPAPKLEVKPKSSCVHCWGRGYEGTDRNTGKKIICRCVKRNYLKANAKARLDDAIKTAAKASAPVEQRAPVPVTAGSGWDEPKAPVGNIEAAVAQ